jgi:serralysin
MAFVSDNNLSHILNGTNLTDTIFAAGGNDIVFGNGGSDFIFGESGNDQLFGMDGNDEFIGGTGDDKIDGGSGIDTVNYAAESTAVVVDLTVSFGGNFGNAGADTLSSIENVFGGGGADFILGTGVNNVLNGGAGNDKVSGGFGSDTLTGGSGADTFGYGRVSESNPGTSSHDVITDFVHGLDKIDLHFIDAAPTVSGDQAFRFVGTANFGFEGDLRVLFTGGNTLIQGNTDSDALPEFEVQLSGLHTISANDFIL